MSISRLLQAPKCSASCEGGASRLFRQASGASSFRAKSLGLHILSLGGFGGCGLCL